MIRHILTLAILLGAVPALAQGSETKTDRPKDPNRKICQKIEVTGSRLGATKICMTEQQWHDQRRAQRDDLERAQQGAVIKPSS